MAVVGQVHRWGWREIWEFVNETGDWSLRQLLEKMWGSYEGRYKRHFDSFVHLTSFLKILERCHVYQPIAGGKKSGHAYGTWNIPPVISNEESFRRERSSKHDAGAAIFWWQISCSKPLQIEAQCTLLVSYLYPHFHSCQVKCRNDLQPLR